MPLVAFRCQVMLVVHFGQLVRCFVLTHVLLAGLPSSPPLLRRFVTSRVVDSLEVRLLARTSPDERVQIRCTTFCCREDFYYLTRLNC